MNTNNENGRPVDLSKIRRYGNLANDPSTWDEMDREQYEYECQMNEISDNFHRGIRRMWIVVIVGLVIALPFLYEYNINILDL